MQPPEVGYDQARAAELRRMRSRATGLLGLVTLLFFFTFVLGDATWVGYVRATAEASMIGGLADWFAVTALFRHPLGLPIPHTAIIPRSKEGLGRNLADFVRRNFLSPDQLVERIAPASLPTRIGGWLSDRDHSVAVAGHVATVVSGVAEGMRTGAIEAELERLTLDRLRSLPIASILGRALEVAMADGHHRQVLDTAIRGLGAALVENRPTLRKRMGQESPWWVPEVVDDAVFDRAFEALQRFIGEVAADQNHELRHTVDVRLVELAHQLQTSPELAARIQQQVDEIITHPEIRTWAASMWEEVMGQVIESARRPHSELRERLADAFVTLGKRLSTDPTLQERIATWVRSLAGPLAEASQREVGDLIAATVDRWDPEETSHRLELWMGRDLQFVRINGTVVGGLAGLVLYSLAQVLGG